MSTADYKNKFPGAPIIGEIGTETIEEQKTGLTVKLQKEIAEIEAFKEKIKKVKEKKENQIRLKKAQERLKAKEERLKKRQEIKPLKRLEAQLNNIIKVKERYRKKFEEVNNNS